jgi:hypothetical protein
VAQHPGFAAVTILTLAFGIGANSLIFSAIQGDAHPATAIRDGDRWSGSIRRIKAPADASKKYRARRLSAWAQQTAAFESFAGSANQGFTLTVNGRPAEWKRGCA